ncbi:CMD domain-containing protein [Pseudenterobacter timonensis]|uniref:CMD domain-containing protein n=1 Tax=Pseudenterobacter timonensis TaxID=1755099 RepID=A0AAE4DLK0_9ENTR|nr:CMD domain-containing protein [Pseudenterobacter timonensis]MDR9889777.1 CMD domain-containing protein [Pseudenterobacter timonensis]
MEQRRFAGKGHWYHETQSSRSPADVLPLVPEAARVNDRFLLDLAIPDEILVANGDWLAPARALCAHLFPLDLPVTRLCTLTAYDRVSAALTVAQACGVQRLCNYYAALLAPLPGPDSSRESNRRLAQITQYARQLASSPDVIDVRAQQQLDEVGLTTNDIILLNQIIGFTGFQARAVAAGQALLGHPVRWLPGHTIQPHTHPFDDEMIASALPPVELRYATAAQTEALARWQTEPELRALTPVLCHDVGLLDLTGALLQSGIRPALTQPLSEPLELLTLSPDRFSAAHFALLRQEGMSDGEAFGLLAGIGYRGWLARLRVGLRGGE